MDVVVIARELTALLVPALPFLIGLGKKAVEKASEELGKDAWEAAQGLWQKLRPRVEAKPAAQEAIEDVAQNPTDEDAQAGLRRQLTRLLTDDPSLAAEIQAAMRSPLIQRVLAERGSQIEDVVQEGTHAEQEVVARDLSTIKGVQQRQR
jgi:uncharacterized protein with von Willebrand factor type A (vWA) domain